MKLHARMLVGLVGGAACGVAAHFLWRDAPALVSVVRYVTEPAGKLFIRLLFMLVIPLIVSALSLGIVGFGDLRRLGRVGMRTLAYTIVVSGIAVLLGVGLV